MGLAHRMSMLILGVMLHDRERKIATLCAATQRGKRHVHVGVPPQQGFRGRGGVRADESVSSRACLLLRRFHLAPGRDRPDRGYDMLSCGSPRESRLLLL